jgi:hypothetical protein
MVENRNGQVLSFAHAPKVKANHLAFEGACTDLTSFRKATGERANAARKGLASQPLTSPHITIA